MASFVACHCNPTPSSRSPSSKHFSRPIFLFVFKPVSVLGTGKLAELLHLNVISMEHGKQVAQVCIRYLAARNFQFNLITPPLDIRDAPDLAEPLEKAQFIILREKPDTLANESWHWIGYS
jgi:hypothetical protein